MMLVSAHTKLLMDNAVQNPAHAVLFSGPEGAGKTHIAKYFAAKKLGLDENTSLENHPYFRVVSPEKNAIAIEQIRALQKFLQLKTPGTADIRRAVIIEDAHYMTNEAQNALLKALEEPPADTIIILTAPKTLRLRDTIYSRVQPIPVLEISKTQALDYFTPDFDTEIIDKNYAISGGLAGLLYALLYDGDHALVAKIQTAKEILAAPVFERLTRADEISKQKQDLPVFLQALKLICSAALEQAVKKGSQQSIKQWHKRLSAVYETEAALRHNPSPKLLLTNLFMEM